MYNVEVRKRVNLIYEILLAVGFFFLVGWTIRILILGN